MVGAMVSETEEGGQVADYLDRIGAGLILDNAEPLSYDYMPDVLVGREDQLSQLAVIFQQIDDHTVSCRVAITGNVGCGKTVLSHVFSRDLQRYLGSKRDLKIVHVNCRNHPSKSQALQRIVTSLDSRHPERGFGSGEILQSIRKQLQNSSEHLILILDEVDHLLRADKGDLLYQLLRIDEGRESRGTISLIIISQEQVLDQLESAVLSRFGRSNHIRLEPYNALELAAIAKQRASLACKEGTVSEGVLRTIGQRASETGDARVAIELLENSVKQAEKAGRAEVLANDVRWQAREIGRTVEPSVVDDLNRHAQMILLALCRRLRKEDEVTTGDSEKLYRVVCEEYEVEPRSHTTFWKHLKRLEALELIEARTDNRSEGRGRTQFLSMPAALPGSLEKRLENTIGQS
ncbi:MAG: AAA family ATPase [Candidatus Thalassarchaeaceae archaeon]|jgi:cell division control protein 6|nr:AAA family ATPase [Candidatus Thalassarchaeaceae archaeon]|tara:strand:- start:296 stop:1513 length:1218 start_codon:yes stop_codon:yes gene_type:complete